jgi:hypothetical protein
MGGSEAAAAVAVAAAYRIIRSAYCHASRHALRHLPDCGYDSEDESRSEAAPKSASAQVRAKTHRVARGKRAAGKACRATVREGARAEELRGRGGTAQSGDTGAGRAPEQSKPLVSGLGESCETRHTSVRRLGASLERRTKSLHIFDASGHASAAGLPRIPAALHDQRSARAHIRTQPRTRTRTPPPQYLALRALERVRVLLELGVELAPHAALGAGRDEVEVVKILDHEPAAGGAVALVQREQDLLHRRVAGARRASAGRRREWCGAGRTR